MNEGEITIEDLTKPKGKDEEEIKQFDLFDPPKDPDADH